VRNEGGGGGFVIARALLVRWRKGLDDFAGSTKFYHSVLKSQVSLVPAFSLYPCAYVLCDVK
jgi:hypothetical protein